MEIHAHEVMRMMLETDAGFSRESLAAAITGRFGADARFYACSRAGMSIGEVIDFLEVRGKFVVRADGFNTAPDRICTHHEKRAEPADGVIRLIPAERPRR